MDLMPQLRAGIGATPRDGGCVIQVASYLWNGEWRDDTPCVHPVLRAAAIRVNDAVNPKTRQKLYYLIPRLMGTASDDQALSVGLALWCAKSVRHLVRGKATLAVDRAIAATEAWLANPCKETKV